MEIDIHLSPFSWQLLHSCLTPALRSRVAASQTPWKPFVWPINTHCAAVVILQQCRHTEEKEKRWNKEVGRYRCFPGEHICLVNPVLPSQNATGGLSGEITPLSWTKITIADSKTHWCLRERKHKITESKKLTSFKGQPNVFCFFLFVMNFDDRILLDLNSATLTYIHVWIFPLPGILKAAGGWSPPRTALLHHFN